jgi:uncharacterized protein YggU (UPF0235/DUF167 family)
VNRDRVAVMAGAANRPKVIEIEDADAAVLE